jgi:hypothetical protein
MSDVDVLVAERGTREQTVTNARAVWAELVRYSRGRTMDELMSGTGLTYWQVRKTLDVIRDLLMAEHDRALIVRRDGHAYRYAIPRDIDEGITYIDWRLLSLRTQARRLESTALALGNQFGLDRVSRIYIRHLTRLREDIEDIVTVSA